VSAGNRERGEANQAGSLRVTMEVDVFSEAWWDSKTLTLDGVDTRGHPGTPRHNWIRWRLIDELLRRYYFRGGTRNFLAEGIWPKWQDYARSIRTHQDMTFPHQPHRSCTLTFAMTLRQRAST
jgi:hypothetical protein